MDLIYYTAGTSRTDKQNTGKLKKGLIQFNNSRKTCKRFITLPENKDASCAEQNSASGVESRFKVCTCSCFKDDTKTL